MTTVNRRTLSSIYIIFLLLGGSILSFIPSFTGIGNVTQWKVLSNLLVFSISSYVFFEATLFKIKLKWQLSALLIFWLFFLMRMVYDLYVENAYGGNYSPFLPFSSTSFFFLYAVGLCLVPFLSVLYLPLNFDLVLKWSFILLLIILTLSLVYNTANQMDNENAVRSRGSEGISFLTYGHLAVTFSLLAFHSAFRNKNILKKLFFLACFIFGIVVMYLAGSRSPLAALVVCLLAYLVSYRGLLAGGIYMIVLVGLIIVFWTPIVSYLVQFNANFMDRVVGAVVEGESSGRDVVYKQAIQQIINSPIIGDALLLNRGHFFGVYPHNMILESLMATGIIGTIFFIIWLVRTLKIVYDILRTKKEVIWVAILFIQYFTFGMFSMAIYTNVMFWYLAGLLWNIYFNNKNTPEVRS